jgi:transposase
MFGQTLSWNLLNKFICKGALFMNYLALDLASKSHRVRITNEKGENICPTFSIENNQDGFNKLTDCIAKLALNPSDILAGLEATNNFWENIHEFLTAKDFKVVLLNPYFVNKFREALRMKGKTDDIDTLVIASLLRTGEYGACLIPDEITLTLRELVKLRYEFLKDQKNYKRQAFALIALVFPEYRQTPIKNPFNIASTQILLQFPTAKDLSTAKPKNIEKIVRSIQGNNFNITEIQGLIDCAKKSSYSGKASAVRGSNLKMILAHVLNLDNDINELDKQITAILSPKNHNDSFPGENLLSIDGVGRKTLAAMLSAIGLDGKSFQDAKAIIGHIGFYPKIYQSGETCRDNRISRRGPKYLRWALYMCAVASIKHNNEMRMLYQRKRSQGKTEKQSLICVAKKLAQMMLAMLKSGQPYNPARVFAVA